MILRYGILCLGCGMLQVASAKTPLPGEGNALDLPLLFLRRGMINIVYFLALLSFFVELWYGFKVIGWWTIGAWALGFGIPALILPSKNPAPHFFLGLIIAVTGLGLVLSAHG